MLPRIHPDRMQIAFDDHCAPASSLFYWNRAWPVRLPLPISPCVNARAHRFGGFGLKGRDIAMKEGIQRWSDPECTASMVGVTGPKRATTLDAILEVNRDVNGLSVRPDVVHAAESEWRATPILEFYVDFETVSDLDDDFTRIPEKGGQPLIFMIGCGHIENGEWQWACFTADSLKETSEAEIIDGWFAHMATVKQRMDSDGDDPNVFHWSPRRTLVLGDRVHVGEKAPSREGLGQPEMVRLPSASNERGTGSRPWRDELRSKGRGESDARPRLYRNRLGGRPY